MRSKILPLFIPLHPISPVTIPGTLLSLTGGRSGPTSVPEHWRVTTDSFPLLLPTAIPAIPAISLCHLVQFYHPATNYALLDKIDLKKKGRNPYIPFPSSPCRIGSP
ncbi:hypothetical protein SODALDRAFT_106164 [Sodiomyces alkalinus F11]|uniref:Uncharacterized protein n=1 Tax=Sodiomyces alkalinus (strain CBS 110278 / VKM F-3762 / F11) TaxID=1314773 RepID=A0A3N2Q2L0_SODAK|nr:hypothetical protein SODALDRAFT_106164 [Sodiomyces alkalinus F11]ROT40855.1 hypothetical protein SODALDRAFT_106164 [Sodiomyces alkalinus F11]